MHAERKAQAGGAKPAARGEAPAQREALGGKKAERLQALLVPEKIVAEHGESLTPAIKDIGKLRELAAELEPHRARQLERLLEQQYKTLGLQLGLAPAADRPAIAQQILGATAKLAGRLRDSEHLLPALFAMTSLLDSGVRLQAQKRLALEPRDAGRMVEASSAALIELCDRLRGRGGVSPAINVFPNLVEQLERASPALDLAQRRELWSLAGALLAETVPGRGFDLAGAARVSELLAQKLAAEKTPAEAVAATREAIHAELAPAVAKALAVARKKKPPVPEAQRAMEKVIAANPLGPQPLFDALADLRGHAEQAADEGYKSLWRSAASLIERFADRPLILELVRRANELIPKAIGRGDEADKQGIVDALAAAAAAKDEHTVARELLSFKLAIKKKPIAEYPGLEKALGALDPLKGEDAILVSLAVSQRLNNQNAAAPMLIGTAELAAGGAGDNAWAVLDGYVERFTALAGALGEHVSEKELHAICAKIAGLTSGAKLENGEAIAELLSLVQAALPRASLSELLAPDARGRSPLLALIDPGIRHRHPPLRFLTEISERLVKYARNAEQQLELGRLAISLAERFGNLDGNPDIPLARMLEDLSTAMRKPEELELGGKPRGSVAVRNAQKPTFAAFLAANPELPPELAATAGIHLKADQLAWLTEKISGARGRDRVRMLRDFIFACVEGDKLGAIDVVRRSKSPAKAISRAITEIAREYRAGHLDRLPWEEILRGLRAGGDPISEIAKRRVEAGMQELEAEVPAAGIGAAGGKAMLEKCAPAIASCLAYYKEKRNDKNADEGIDHGACIAPLEAAVKSVRDGTWPSVKYETAIGRRLLACLSPEQQAVWRQEMVTPAEGAAPIAKNAAMPEVTKLLGGLSKALPLSVRLPEGWKWNQASLDKVRAQRAELIDAIHDVEKGSPKHKELGARLGAISRPVIALELKMAIDAAIEEGGGAKAILLKLKPLLPEAERALRRLEAIGAADAVAEIRAAAETIRDVRQPARFGRYSVDEDSLEALIMSHTETSGSCINYESGFRRWALAGSAADANIRMLRTYDGDKFSYRAFLKVFYVEMKGYKGPALWLDEPCAEGPEGDGDLDLLYKTAIRKGLAMGIPIMAPGSDLTDVGEKMGLKTLDGEVKFTIDPGNTDCMHSDHMFGGAGNLRALRGKKKVAIVECDAQIVMPR